MKLYELSQNYAQLVQYAEDEEIDMSLIQDTLDSIEDGMEDKFENISKLIKSLEGDIATFKDEEKRIGNRRKAMENKVDGLKRYMFESLGIIKKDSVKAGTFKIAKQKNPPSIDVFDKSKLDNRYLIPQEPKEDKKLIMEDLKAGKIVEGASIAPDSYHLRIR